MQQQLAEKSVVKREKQIKRIDIEISCKVAEKMGLTTVIMRTGSCIVIDKENFGNNDIQVWNPTANDEQFDMVCDKFPLRFKHEPKLGLWHATINSGINWHTCNERRKAGCMAVAYTTTG